MRSTPRTGEDGTDGDAVNESSARECLTDLRARLQRGECDVADFRYRAARAYLADNKPLRALAFLEILDRDYQPEADAPTVMDLVSRAVASHAAIPHPTCTLNMIARNEGPRIGAALDSVDDIMDEIVVGDTGSDDDTVAVALMYGARVATIGWQNDFSFARNQVLGLSTCGWIFWMDADDRLEPASSRRLRDLWRSSAPQAVAFCVANTTSGKPGPEFLQFRLFPRDKDIQFERPVHEQFVKSAIRRGLACRADETIRIMHTGYCDPQTQVAKATRNKPLIESAVSANPADLVMRMSLGECYMLLGELDQATTVFRDLADDPENFSRDKDVHAWAHLNAGRVFRAQGRIRDAKRYLFRCLFINPGIQEAQYLLGMIFSSEENHERSLYFFVKAAQSSPPLQLMAASDRTTLRLESLYQVASILLRLGKIAEAEETLRRALQAYPQVVQYHTLMGKVHLAHARLLEAAECFSHSMAMSPSRNPEAYVGLATLYSLLGDHAKSADFLNQALRNGSRSAGVFAMIGDLHAGTDDPTSALVAYEEALKCDRDKQQRAKLLGKAASCALETSKPQRARSYAHQLLKLDPENLAAAEILDHIDLMERAA